MLYVIAVCFAASRLLYRAQGSHYSLHAHFIYSLSDDYELQDTVGGPTTELCQEQGTASR